MERKNIFGNTVQVPTDKVVAVTLSTRRSGTITENYGVEYHYLMVTFQIEVTPIKKEIFLARGTDGYGSTKPIRNPLFVKLHEKGLPEEIRDQLSNFLMDEYNKGHVKEKDVIKKMEDLFEVNKKLG